MLSFGASSVIKSFNTHGTIRSSWVHVLVGLACCVTASRAWSADCVPAPPGLVSWWQAEANGNDVVGTNNGTLMNGAGFAPGKVGQAFSFNGVNQYVSVPDSPSLRPTNLTVEGWVNFSTLSGDSGHLIAKPFGVVDLDSFAVAYYAGQLMAAITRASGMGPLISYNWTPAVGTWHHIAYTFNNASSTQMLFVDGIAVASSAVSGPIVYDTHPFLIGADIQHETPMFFLGGLLDEAALYNRALSAVEIAAIYNSGSAGKCPPGVAPSIIAQPTSQSVLPGATATFNVSATGTPPLSYQWLLNGVSIAGVNGTSLTLSNVQPIQAGTYSLRVTNGIGSTTSSNALLTVLPMTNCTPVPTGILGWWRGESNATDSVGNHNGIMIGGTAFAAGEVGQAFSFNGLTAAVNLGDWFDLQTFSLAMWVKASASQVTDANLIDNNHGDAPWRSWTVQYENTGLHFIWGLFLTGGDFAYIPFELNSNTWQYLVLALDSNRVARVYLDGQMQGSTVLSGAISYNGSQSLSLGHSVAWGRYFNGLIDEVDVYDRALALAEIQAIYNAGSAGKCRSVPPPRGATATANLVNDFVVGATITDGGYGYTNTPTVRIIGGGSGGAQAVAVVSNGVVIAINILNAGFGYTNTPVIVIAPPFIPQPKLGIEAMSLLSFTNLTVGTNYQLQLFSGHTWSNLGVAFTAASSTFMQYVPGTAGPNGYRLAATPVPSQAYASAQMVNGFVVGATVISGGSGYGSSPAVSIVGGGGSNATATAAVSGGGVAGITITSAGLGYTTMPTIVITPPPANALWPIVTQAMELNLSDLSPYENYQVEFAPAAGGVWSDLGIPFTTPSTMNTQYINVSGSAGCFRVRYAP